MGVPKFYRWISERYPCLSEVVKEYQIPEFDNLYLDMNGIVHVCSHPEDDNPHFRITEEKIFQDIFHYIEVLFRMIRPQKVFFMAIDGVAPRAKMNQQRGRRFRSAKEAENLIKQAEDKGEILPTEKRFDSNCITPGTEFMVKLQEQLKYFVVKKVTTDPIWQGIKIYLSGHQTPGEGEHKVMDFIRHQKSLPDHDPNTRHCLYGLDADLIMLGLTSHEPHFSLLREEVRFGGKKDQKRATTPEETTFHLLHLSLMREYLEFEFAPLKECIPGWFDIERIIDDWVLMGFLVGNDFIPHLPYMHIHTESLPTLWKTYMEVIPTLDGYLNEDGKINLHRFEKFMTALAQKDIDEFQDQYADLKWLEGKTGRKKTRMEMSPKSLRRYKRLAKKVDELGNIPTANQFMNLVEADDEDFEKELGVAELSASEEEEEEEDEESSSSEEEEESEDDLFQKEFRMHKDNYYMEKMEYSQVTKEVLKEQSEGYIKALQWILYYYYRGCPSWSWYYEHHYAPYISDVKNFADLKINFEISKPFLPFEQLMAVLPSASKELLPEAFQALMENASSEILDFYPKDFQTDLNGKKQEWEAVVLIPFIDEKRLLSAMTPLYDKMTMSEKARNCHGPHLLFETSPEPVGTYPSSLPESFPDIINSKAKITEVPIDNFVVPYDKLKFGRPAGCLLDVYYPGFPTLRHIPHTAELDAAGVKVFQQNSRHDNMMLTILPRTEETKNLEKLAHELLGEGIYVGWPHLFEARVTEVSNGEYKYYMEKQSNRKLSNEKSKIVYDAIDQKEATKWAGEVNHLKEAYHDRKGVIVGSTEVMLRGQPMTGRKYICGSHGNITLEKQWSDITQNYLYQASVRDIAVKDPTFMQYKTIDQLFNVGSEVFMLGSPHYGTMGKVLDIDPTHDGRIRVEFNIYSEPDLERVKHKERFLSTKYYPGHMMAQRLGISGYMVSRITGTIFVTKGSKQNPGKSDARINIGLNLKFNRKNEEVIGYTKKTEDGWLYSHKALDELCQYIEEFPTMFDYLSSHLKEDTFFEDDIFTGDVQMKDVTKFLKTLPCTSAMRTTVGSETLDHQVVAEIEKEIAQLKANTKKFKIIKMQVRPHLLYRPLDAQRTLIPDSTTTYELYDRVVNIRNGYSVPLGLRGTVVGIYPAEKEMETIYEVVFDEEFLGGLTIRSSPNRGYRMPPFAMLNKTHGERKEQNRMQETTGRKPTAVVKPQTNQRGSNHEGSSYSQMTNRAPRFQDRHDNERYNDRRRDNRFDNNNHQEPRHPDNWQDGHQDGHHSNRQRHPPYPNQNQNASSRNYHQNKGQKNFQKSMKGEDEFTSLWKQLQTNIKFEEASSKDTTMKPGPSLSQAAKSLPNTFEPNWMKVPQEPQSYDQVQQLQKVNLDMLFLKAGSSLQQEAMTASTNESANEEFLNMMKSLEVSHKSSHKSEHSHDAQDPAILAVSGKDNQPKSASDKESTAALQELLKIGQHSNNTVTTQQTPHYNKQVSVQELFNGFQAALPPQQQQQQQPHQTQQQQQPHQPQQQQQQQPHQPQQQQQIQKPQGKPAVKRSKVTELQQWCMALGMPAPQYDLTTTNDGSTSATVSLPNGMRFQGVATKRQEQAFESAASVALLSVQKGVGSMPLFMMGQPTPRPHQYHHQEPQPQQQQQQMQGPRGNFSSSPNSAFTPVRPSGKGQKPFFEPKSNMSFNYNQPPPRHGGPQHPTVQGWGTQGPGYSPRGPYNQGRPSNYGGQAGHYGNQGGHYGNQGGHYGNQGGHYGNQGQHGHQHGNQRQHGYHGQPGFQGQHGYQGHQNHYGNQGNQQYDARPRGRNDSWRDGSQEKQVSENQPSDQNTDSTTPAKNPFVPLQVLKKQKTPQRDIRKKIEDSFTPEPVDKSPQQKQETKSKDSRPRYQESKRDSKQKSDVHKQDSKPKDSKEKMAAGKESDHKKPRRQRSRIAANFGASS